MVRTSEYVKMPSGTMFFPRVILTREEAERMHRYGQVPPAWIRLVAVNYEEFTDVFSSRRPMKSADAYRHLVAEWTEKTDEIIHDVHTFADGEIGLVDLSVKYGVGYKKCRQFAKDVIAAAGKVFDVDFYWKQHKKHAQRETTSILYGVSHTSQVPGVQEKRRSTNQARYGADNPMQAADIQEKLRKKMKAEHGIDYAFSSPSVKKTQAVSRPGSFLTGDQVAAAFDASGIQYLTDVELMGLSFDFYIPEKQVAVNINQNDSHSSNLYAHDRLLTDPVETSFHYRQYKKAKDLGITLIQLFGNDLEPSVFQKVTARRLVTMLSGPEKRYYARDVDVRRLTTNADRKRARAFLDEYHSQGSSRANEYWAFVKDGEWLGAASFTKNREMELKRLCFRPDIQIVGGLSKIISHYFRMHPEVPRISSYSDNNLGSGMGYQKAGARFVKETGPSLKFISPVDGRDCYSWQIATSWGADSGVVGNDADDRRLKKPVGQAAINEYIEKTLIHRFDDGCGYDRVYTAGSKLWMFERS